MPVCLPMSIFQPITLGLVAAAVLSGGVVTSHAQSDLELPTRASARPGLSLRQQEHQPSLVVRPPSGPGTQSAQSSGIFGDSEPLRWRTYRPTPKGVEEVAAAPVPRALPILKTTPVALLHSIVLLPGETALELVGVDASPAAMTLRGDASGKANAVRQHLRTYASEVKVAPDFIGVRDHGTRPPEDTMRTLHNLLGQVIGEGSERSVAEALILGFATAGQPLEDVVVVRDESAPGTYKVIVFPEAR